MIYQTILNESNLKISGKAICKLGIQAEPGTKFTINSENDDNGGQIEIGKYGIYELDLSGGLGTILSIKLVSEDKEAIIDYVTVD